MKKLVLIFFLLGPIFISGCTQEAPTEIPTTTQPSEEELQSQSEQTEEFNPSSYGNPHPKIKESPPLCCNHPYWHKVYRAFSQDGISWKKENVLIRDHASVPAIIQKDDGFILYYVNGEIDTLDCSISKYGKSFTQGNCIIYGFTEEKVWDPYVVKLDNDFYRMYFFAPRFGRENRILSAISKDGINWLQEEGVRFKHRGIIDPAVIKMDNIWWMYTWYDAGPGKSIIVVAKSDDGLNFVKETEFDIGGGVPEIVKLDSGKYALYFCRNGIEMVTSTDGLTWSGKKIALAPSPPKIVCDPSIIKTEEEWVMYYKEQEAQIEL